jgi:dolichol kinase
MKHILFNAFRVILIALTFLVYFIPYFIWNFKMPKLYHELVNSWKRDLRRKRRHQTF